MPETLDRNLILFKSKKEIEEAVAAQKKSQKDKDRAIFNMSHTKAAIQRGDSEIISYLISQGLPLRDDKPQLADYKAINAPMEALVGVVAVGQKVVKKVQDAFVENPSKRAKISKDDDHKTNALHIAAKEGQAEILRELILFNRLDPAARDANGDTPYDIAKKYGGNKEVKNFMMQILTIAQEYYDTQRDSAKALINRMDLNHDLLPKITEPTFPESRIVMDGASRNIEQIWADVSKRINDEYKKFQEKVKKSEEQKDKFLNNAFEGILTEADIINHLDANCLIDVTTGRGQGNQSALHKAAQNGHVNCVKLLLDYNINTEAVDSEGKTARDLATEKYESLQYSKPKEAAQYLEIIRQINYAREHPSSSPHDPNAKQLDQDLEIGRG